MDISESYIFCKEAGITSAMLYNNESITPIFMLKKGLVLELLKIKKMRGTWPMYKQWIEKLIGVDHGHLSVNSLRKSVLVVETQHEKIKKNMYRVGTSELEKYMQEPYKLPGHFHSCPCPEEPVTALKGSAVTHDFEVIASVNKSLAKEVSVLKEELATEKQELLTKDSEI